MSLSTLETLPDEILMIIIGYSGDIYTVYRTFSGLNQRFNSILIDRRLHLITSFLCMNIDDIDIYKSDQFQDICQQLLSIKATDHTEHIKQCLQSLVSFHITSKYKQSLQFLASNMKNFQSIRQNLPNDGRNDVDNELEKTFIDLQICSNPMKTIKQIQYLVLTKGATLENSLKEDVKCNFAHAINHLILSNMNNIQSVPQSLINSLIQMFKILIISNPMLLYNRIHMNGQNHTVYYTLSRSIYNFQTYNYIRLSESFNIQYYRAAVDLLVFILQCSKYLSMQKFWKNQSFLNTLQVISSAHFNTIADEIFVNTSQIEILKILLDENIFHETIDFDIEYQIDCGQPLKNLIVNNRLDMILFIFNYHEQVKIYFQNLWNSQIMVDIMMKNQTRKKLFDEILTTKTLGLWLATCTDLLFVLLQRKQYTFVKKLIDQSPLLINKLDEDGNDPLIYICLKVRGCRHRLVEYLIRIGCDLQRRNFQNQSFTDALQIERNHNLLEKLIELEILYMDYGSQDIKINLVK